MTGQVNPEGPESGLTTGDSPGVGPHSEGVWLVLGGGGLKGMTHVGAYRALEEAGVRPAGIVGTSIGALVGASIASGMGAAEMTEIALSLERKDIARLNRGAIWINGIRELSVFRGRSASRVLRRGPAGRRVGGPGHPPPHQRRRLG